MIKIPEVPHEIDPRIDKKFTKWRGKNHEQKKAVEFILNNPKKYALLIMPTGYGKSLVAISAGIKYPGKVIIITKDTNLAKQYEKDFKIPVITGRKHYKCIMYPELTAENCPYAGHYNQCPAIKDILDYYEVKTLDELSYDESEEITCPYVRMRELARKSDVAVLNYHYFYFAYQNEGKWPKPAMVIVDEAHEFPDFLIDVSTKRFPFKNLYRIDHAAHNNEYQKIFLPTKPKLGGETEWREVRKYFRRIAKKKAYHLIKEIEELLDNDVIPPEDFLNKTNKTIKYLEDSLSLVNWLIKYMDTLSPNNTLIKELKMEPSRASIICEELDENLKTYCDIIKEIYPTAKVLHNFIKEVESNKNNIIRDSSDISGNYILYPKGDYIVMKAIYPHKIFEKIEEKLGNPKWVFMSATLFPRFLSKELAIAGQYSWMDTQPETPVEFRTVFYVPYAPLYRDYMDQKPFVREYITNVIDEVLREYNKEKGIILVASKKDIEALMTYSKYKERLIEYSGSNKEKKISLKDHAASKNSVLVSVAWEGIDLPDELSRFQIIFQVPFLNVGDPRIRIRRRADREWYYLSALNKIIQGAGRSIRHKDDFAATFIFDSRFENMIKRYSNYLPSWFLESIKKYGSIEEKAKFRSNLERALTESREYYKKWKRVTSI